MGSTSVLETHFPTLAADESLRSALYNETETTSLAPKEYICMEGHRCGHLALVLAGRARVYKTGSEGHELTMYRVHPGESCILTTSCILSDRPFPAFARTETELTARMVPAPRVKEWMERFPVWRRYVFDLLANRLDAVITTLEEVAFRRLDARLAATLLEAQAADEDDTVYTTHGQLAADLGSAREVISRLLKHFEQDGLLTLERGAISIRDPDGLKQIVEPP